MKEKIVIFDIDDCHPEKGFGLDKDMSNLKYIKMLNKTFGLKATLYVPLNWHGKFPLWENKEWVKWLLKLKKYGHEISAHGFYHEITPNNQDSREFLRYDLENTKKVLETIKKNWIAIGFNVEGIRFPGWGETKFTELETHKHFKYIATHMIGEKPIVGHGGIIKTPYNLSIDNLYDCGHDTYIIHAHIGPEGTNDNNLNFETYKKLVDFLHELKSKYSIKYMTTGEWIKWQKMKMI